jgi:hypothetical protein
MKIDSGPLESLRSFLLTLGERTVLTKNEEDTAFRLLLPFIPEYTRRYHRAQPNFVPGFVAERRWSAELYNDFLCWAWPTVRQKFRLWITYARAGQFSTPVVLIALNWAVQGAQKKTSGYKVFKNVESAIRLACEQGTLHMAAHGVVQLNPPGVAPCVVASGDALDRAVATLHALQGADLLLQLASGRRSKTVRSLAAVLPNLRDTGVAAFRVGDLVSVLARHAQRVRTEEDHTMAADSVASEPDVAAAARQRYEALVSDEFASFVLAWDGFVADSTWRAVAALRGQVVEALAAGTIEWDMSMREKATLLGIPRQTFHRHWCLLMAALNEFVATAGRLQ